MTNAFVLFSPCPPSNPSAAAPAARPGTDLVGPKGCHEMRLSDELPEERINSLTWDGKEYRGRYHVTACAARTGPATRDY